MQTVRIVDLLIKNVSAAVKPIGLHCCFCKNKPIYNTKNSMVGWSTMKQDDETGFSGTG